MSERDPEGLLARLFDELRRADEASAPRFGELLAQARARQPAAAGPFWRTALIAAAAAALAVTFLVLRRSSVSRPQALAGTLAEWKAPTDVLLRTPGAELLDGLPALAPPVFGGSFQDTRRTAGPAPPAVPTR